MAVQALLGSTERPVPSAAQVVPVEQSVWQYMPVV